MTRPDPVDLGDSVEATTDGWHIILMANSRTETIYVDRSVWVALTAYAASLGWVE